MSIQVGEKAPNFTLYNTQKKPISLADFKGSTLVLHFFPQAFTGVCTQQMCTMRDDLAYYNDLNAKVVGISVDSVFTLAKFKEFESINFDLLSDFNKTVIADYGIVLEEFVFGMKGVSRRAAFVIDAEGVVRYAEVLASAGDLPNFDALRAAVETCNGTIMA